MSRLHASTAVAGILALAAVIERIRIEGRDLRLVVAGLAMGATAATLEPLLATAPPP